MLPGGISPSLRALFGEVRTKSGTILRHFAASRPACISLAGLANVGDAVRSRTGRIARIAISLSSDILRKNAEFSAPVMPRENLASAGPEGHDIKWPRSDSGNFHSG